MAAARSTLAGNFKPGDLLYGLENQRELVRLALEKIANPDAKKMAEVGKVPVTVDPMNSLVILLKNPVREAQTIAWLKGDVKSVPDGISSGIALTSLQKHFAVQTAASKKVNINNSAYPVNRKKLSLEARIIRRACKAALEGYPIHFILEGLDAQHIFNELYSTSQPPLKSGEGRRCFYDSHTSAELRQVIKNIKKLNIKFYCLSKNFAAEVTALVTAAGADAMNIEYEYLRSGKAFVEVDLYYWLARKDLAYEQHLQGLGPVQTWLTAKRDQKTITGTPLATLESRKAALRATFIASPGVASASVARANADGLDLSDDLDDLEGLPASDAAVAIASSAGVSQSQPALFHHAEQAKAQGSPQVGAVAACISQKK